MVDYDSQRYLFNKQLKYQKMKHLIAGFVAVFALTANASNFQEMAQGRVLSVEPLTQTVFHRVPQQSCSVTIEGDRQVERCQNYTDRVFNQRITGYRVKFEYRDTVQTLIMKRDPGSHVALKVVTTLYVLE